MAVVVALVEEATPHLAVGEAQDFLELVETAALLLALRAPMAEWLARLMPSSRRAPRFKAAVAVEAGTRILVVQPSLQAVRLRLGPVAVARVVLAAAPH